MRYFSLAVAAGFRATRIAAIALACCAMVVLPRAVAAQASNSVIKSINIRSADSIAWRSIAAAEDARAATPEQLRVILDGTRAQSVDLRALSVRALGRLQRPDLTDSISRSLRDASPIVRMHAAQAIAHANFSNRVADSASAILIRALSTERSDTVVGAIAESLGRLRPASPAAARVMAMRIASHAFRGAQSQLGAVRGLHFMARQAIARPGLDSARNTLVRIATTSKDVHARRIAVTTIALAGLGNEKVFFDIMNDADPIVRREAVLIGGPQQRDSALAFSVIARGLMDPYWMVRFESLRQMGLRGGSTVTCDSFAQFANDAHPHVRIELIDILGRRCTASPRTVRFLDSTAATLPMARDGSWHAAAHALVSLAARDPDAARKRLTAFARHPNLFVRTYAASAAAIVRDTTLLRNFAHDAAPNVRAVAVEGLSRIVKHAADSIYLAQLSLDDSQLLMAAVGALDSTNRADAAPLILDALDRITAYRRENSRDGRVALLNAAGRLGSAALAERVRPYLNDYDPAVAARAAAVLAPWTGVTPTPAPRALDPEAMPSFRDLARLASTVFKVVMEDGREFEVSLLPFDAPTNAARFARLASTHYFDGLTLHRVEPNFVVQGGSPNANEYAGAPRFSRDEIGYPNDRGTIGLSTRGHDTGDAQIFINAIDNTQLDTQYTVFGYVSRGMDAVDGILEGAVIRSVTPVIVTR